MGIEREQETALIRCFKKLGAQAFHMDVTVDGFSDILVASNERIALIEIKYAPVSARLTEVFEPTQPVFFSAMQKSNFHLVFACVWDGREYHLYGVRDLLKDILLKRKTAIRDMELLRHGDAGTVASYVMALMTVGGPYV